MGLAERLWCQWEVAKRLNAFLCRFVVQAVSVVLPFSGCVAKRLLTPTNELNLWRFAALHLTAGLLHSQPVTGDNIVSCCPCKAESSSASTTIQRFVSTLVWHAQQCHATGLTHRTEHISKRTFVAFSAWLGCQHQVHFCCRVQMDSTSNGNPLAKAVTSLRA